MHSIAKPTIVFSDLLAKCIEKKKEPAKTSLGLRASVIISATDNYDDLANKCRLYELSPLDDTILAPATRTDVQLLYDYQMLKGPGRDVYDQLLAEGKQQKCCYCSHRDPTQLDHFLPQSTFPEFAIFPCNLVPSCSDCNKWKLTTASKILEEMFIHPYYEEYRSIVWLNASIDFAIAYAPTITFSVAKELKISNPDLAARIQFQLRTLKLIGLYSSQSASEIAGISEYLGKLFTKGGQPTVREYLMDIAESWRKININSWQTALYKCLYQSDEFCEMKWKI